MSSNPLCLYVGFLFSIIYGVISGIDIAFNTYALAVKETFNFTQTQVELVASWGMMGWGLAGLETLSTSFLGYTATYTFVVVVIPLFSGMFALAVHFKTFFHDWPSLICIFQLLISVGNCIGFVSITRVCIENLPQRHSGKLVGMYFALMCLGKVFLSVLMESVHGDMMKFFLIFGGLGALVTILCVVLLYPFSNRTGSTKESGRLEKEGPTLLTDKSNLLNDNEDKDVDVDHTTSIRDIVTSPFLHAVFWPSAVSAGSGFAALNNITAIAEAELEENPLRLVYVMSIAIMLARVAFGAALDNHPTTMRGLVLVSFSLVINTTGLLTAMFSLSLNTLPIISVLLGVGMAPMSWLPVSILLLQYGRSNYSLLLTGYMTLIGVGTMAVQLIMGRLYDWQIEVRHWNGTRCYGKYCFFWSFVVLLVISLVTLWVYLILCIHRVMIGKKR